MLIQRLFLQQRKLYSSLETNLFLWRAQGQTTAFLRQQAQQAAEPHSFLQEVPIAFIFQPEAECTDRTRIGIMVRGLIVKG